ncbi:SDR family oxidoreductase [Anaerofustis stercorihominis]|uniref:3-oxoacyl-[acyl-carrier-protein] reductase n=2 Tax=Anaerofustis stercorihominis TaxID=214853 RepID=B1C680_9FIRM|nr:SDR family oxidoreductase [Anaerofustis stercorihominis]EDS73365.1 putative 3-oxoacyl-[acyl-carrier-protein] reductase [Anaerofustis stercorihominis DSM 17244]MCQ4794817.1 SDR family oxidoreductase [Anaerofustis stercorihominis]RGD75521.1 SDR family oxidoreductase [Anaerofustis stercorihominis]
MKSCIITGASQGIGRATAVKMSYEEGIKNIALIARNVDNLNKTKELMNPECNVIVVPHDMMDLDGIEGVVDNIYKEFGSIDLLINGAGFVNPTALLDTTNDNFERTFTINTVSMLVMIRSCVRYMKGKDAKILNIASTAGSTSRPGWVAYAAAKAGVISLSKTLADELRGYKIKVYCISPGRCATELRRILAPEEDPATIMQPEDVADVIANLLSSGENCLDGQDIVVRQK